MLTKELQELAGEAEFRAALTMELPRNPVNGTTMSAPNRGNHRYPRIERGENFCRFLSAGENH